MKQASKHETEILGLINSIQAQLMALDKKVDTLVSRSLPEIKKPHSQPSERIKYTAICADCKKECTIPFKPSGDRPVYCQDCFSRRKVINMSGMKVDPQINVPAPPVKSKKKAAAKKKPAPKKK